MIVADLTAAALTRTLAGPGLRLRTGPVVTRIQSSLPTVARGIALHYAEHPTVDEDVFADFHVRVGTPRNVRRWLRPQAHFFFDGWSPFTPLPLAQGFPMLEWGLNWCVSAHCHQYLIIHAAVVERNGRALVLPAPPGSGKSTLCAGLVSRGWRLLSDELTLIDFEFGNVVPLPRPVSLKNASIDAICGFAPDAIVGPPVHDTVKGSVAHMKPPATSVRRASEPASPRWIVLPRFEKGVADRLAPLSKARAFMQLADHAFNYSMHGSRGFELLAQLVEACGCFELAYGDLDASVRLLNGLADDR
ncbi:MAG: HprK-related kinase A [Betaproteobacteria bacterium]